MSHTTCTDHPPSAIAPPPSPSSFEANSIGPTLIDAVRIEAASTEAITSRDISTEVAHTEAVSMDPTPSLRDSPALIFHLYSKLPLELRTMILRVLIDEPRTLKFVYTGLFSKPSIASTADDIRTPVCKLDDKQIPSLLHASKDTRDIALRSYKAVSPNFLANPFYFNETSDILSLGSIGVTVAVATQWTNIHEMRISTLTINMSHIPDVEFLSRQILKLEVRAYSLDEKNQLLEWCNFGERLAIVSPESSVVRAIETFQGSLGKVVISGLECEPTTPLFFRKLSETINIVFPELV